MADPGQGGSPVVVRCREIIKYFGGVRALWNVSLDIRAGEVTCLLGDNGAGKSTLTKIILGQLRPESGEVEINGRAHKRLTPRKVLKSGVAVVPQTLALCDNLSAAQNAVLGQEPVFFRVGPIGVLNPKSARDLTAQRITEIGTALPNVNLPVRRLSGGQRQAVALARALHPNIKLLVLDEPTAALGVHQTHTTLELVKRLRDRGIGVLMITHELPAVMDLADRVVGLKLGEVVLDKRLEETDEQEVFAAMGGGRV